jgi:nucleoid-associated protein YgaU
MAIRREDLTGAPETVVVRLPVRRARARHASGRRIERRRRAAAGVVAILALAGLWTSQPAADAPERATTIPRAVVVRPGDTLWDVAERYAPDGRDPRAYVAELVALNHLHGPLPAGFELELPR